MRIAFGKAAPKLSESDVTQQIKDFMEWRQWRAVRFQRTVVQLPGGGAFSTGEPGQADWQFIRYIDSGIPGTAIVLWVEMKAKDKVAKCRCATKKPHARCTACDQKTWKERERKRGGMVWQVITQTRHKYGNS